MRTPLTCAALLVATSCSPHRVVENPEPPIAVPAAFGGGGHGPAPDRWWRAFHDPALTRVVTRTLEGNLQLRAAWARLAQAAAAAREAGAARFPILDATLNGSRRKLFNQFSTLDPTGNTPSSFQINTYSASLAANYELDVWKKASSQARGAARDARAARGEVESIAMTLVAQVAETWYDVVLQRARRRLLDEQLELNKTLLELVQMRYRGGVGSVVEVLQQKQQVIATQAQLVQVDSAEKVLLQRLAVLTGQSPEEASLPVAGAELPELPPLPGTGIPADLLNRRPDVRAARDRVAAADYRVAVAVADRFPALRIGATLDFQETSLVDLFKTPLWSIFGSITEAIFDGGRRAAEVDRRKAVVDELLWSYGQTLLDAVAEVERALVQEREQVRLIERITDQVEVSTDNLREARLRYEQGISTAGFLDVLNALQVQQAAQLDLLAARRQLISYRIQLCRALGGSWTTELRPGPVATPSAAPQRQPTQPES